MDKCREAFEKNRFWVGIFRADVVFKSEIGEFGLYEALNSKVEAEYLVEFNNKWVIWYQCWQSRQAELDQAYADIETFAQAHQRDCDIKVQIANELKEKDKRIEVLENRIEEGLGFIDKFHCEGWLSDLDNAEKALRGEHE